jgi:hypothetical protein
MRPVPSNAEAGFSLLEILVSVAHLGIIAWQVSDSLTMNMEARRRIEQQRQFLEVEAAVRGGVFRTLSKYMEAGPNCNNAAALAHAFDAQPFGGVSFNVLTKPSASLPPAMSKRCPDQTYRGKIAQGIYTCLQLDGDGKGASFLAKNDAYAEVFYGLWNVKADAAVQCTDFNDVKTPLRGAKLFYTIYWKAKKGLGAKESRFSSYSGVMYGQSKEP